MSENTVKYSVIVLLEERHEDFAEFIQNLYNLFSDRDESFEIVIMANGTGGFLRNELTKLENFNDKLKAFELNIKTPQAICLKTGLKATSGKIIIACDSYQQITDSAFLQLLDSLDDETDIIIPWRQQRVDTLFRQFRSKIFNLVVRKITKTNLHDLNCTVKIFRQKVLAETELYGNMFRYLPILAEQKGFKTKEIKCEHYQERGGKSGLSNLPEYFTRMIDLLTLYFNTRFTRKPLRFFSAIGLFFFFSGLLITSYVFSQKLLLSYPIGNRLILLIALFLMLLGVQVSSIGLLGEIITFINVRHKKDYNIEKMI
jgi:hypothetical protein